MPEHTTLLHYLIYHLGLAGLADNFGKSIVNKEEVNYHGLDPIFFGAIIMVIIVLLLLKVRGKFTRLDEASVPEDKLTLRTFFEVFFSYFYNMAKDIMGEKNTKRYFPVIGSFAIFIFISNVSGLIPGCNPPTSSLNITLACGLLVFILFNYYGLKENGLSYLKHLAGPMPAIAPLIVPIELISLCARPFTLAIRLMLNMAVDHMLATIFLGLFAFLLPLPIFFLGIIVICVQTLVFCLLTTIYIALATEHEEAHH